MDQADTRVGAVAVVVLDGPLQGERAALLNRRLQDAAGDPATAAVAVIGLGLSDTTGEADVAPWVDRLGAAGKPLVVALSGQVEGAWAALALAATERLATPDTTFAFADVTVGLVPSGGVTQRLPRLIGAVEALRLMLTGVRIGAGEAQALGLVDEVAAEDLAARAVARAQALIAAGPAAVRRDGRVADAAPAAWQAAVLAARKALAGERGGAAPARIVDCVEAALLLPLEQGAAFEAAALDDLRDGDEAAGLAHARAVERLLLIDPEADGSDLAAVSIWGTEGRADGLVLLALAAGLEVRLCADTRAALVGALERIAATQDSRVAEGAMTQGARDADWARLSPCLDPQADGPVILCAGSEDWAALAPAQAIWADVAAPTGRLHLALPTPATSLPAPGNLVELAVGSDEPAAPALALLRRIGLRPVLTGPGGPIVLRLRAALAAAIAHLEGQGVTRARIAAALSGRAGAGAGPHGDDELAQRCRAAVTNAAARLIADGVAPSPDTIDLLAIGAGIYPRWTGGPLFQADRRGLLLLRRDLRRWGPEVPAVWSVAPLIDTLVAEGRRFGDLAAS